MATQTVVTCDMHDDGTTPGSTVAFGVEGAEYELDLCDSHRAELAGSVQRFVDAARTTRRGSRATGRRSGGSRGRNDLSAVRAWAAANGYTVGDRGRIPATVLEAYQARGSGRSKAAPAGKRKARAR